MYSEEKIVQAIEEHFKQEGLWNGPDSVDVRIYDDNAYVTLSRMYGYVEFGFEFLEMLSKEFDTKKINVGDRESSPGCDTCDWGSSYTLGFTVKKIGSTKN